MALTPFDYTDTLPVECTLTKNGKWFCWVVVMGSAWELCCFALRAIGARDQQNSAYVITSTLLFLLAPLCTPSYALDRCPILSR